MRFKAIWALLLVAVVILVMPGIAYAQDGGDVIDKDVVTLDVSLLALLAGFIVPVITAIVTTKWSSSAWKAVTTAILAVVAGSLAVWIEHAGKADLSDFGMAVFEAAIVAWSSYYGFWRPTSIAPAVMNSTPNFLLGKRAA